MEKHECIHCGAPAQPLENGHTIPFDISDMHYPRCRECYAGWLVEKMQYSPSAVWRAKFVKARNEYLCIGCRETIRIGEQHWYTPQSSDNYYPERVRICDGCLERYRSLTEKP